MIFSSQGRKVSKLDFLRASTQLCDASDVTREISSTSFVGNFVERS